MPSPQIESLVALLGRRIDDSALIAEFGPGLSQVDCSDFTAYFACQEIGVSIAFKKGAGLEAQGEAAGIQLVNAFHLHGSDQDGYRVYDKPLPAGIHFGDAEISIVEKLGTPTAGGGGKYSAMQKRTLERWIKYARSDRTILHYRFSLDGKLDMVTLIVEKV
jgi:hypothetical protein